MVIRKFQILIIFSIIFISCENDEDITCSLNGIEDTIIATSFFEWKYFIVTDSGFQEIDFMTDDEAQNSYDWDIAMMRNHFRTNSGLSGPANGGVYMFDETWDCSSFNQILDFSNDLTFTQDSILTNIYQLGNHENPDDAYTEDEGNHILENWGWFDIDNSYYFNYTHKKFIVKLPPEDDPRYIKLWPYQYYGDLGESAHISLIYDFIVPSE